MNRTQIFAVVVIVTALIAGTWAVGRVQESTDNTYTNIERSIQVLTKVRDHYVEPVTSDKLMDSAIRGMLRTLDPYSQYLDKEEAQRLETTTHGDRKRAAGKGTSVEEAAGARRRDAELATLTASPAPGGSARRERAGVRAPRGNGRECHWRSRRTSRTATQPLKQAR